MQVDVCGITMAKVVDDLPDENTMAISWEREPRGMVEWLDVMM